MSEHTPLTEEDLAAIITAEVAGLHAETTGAATAMGKHLAGVLAPFLAARTSTATADTGQAVIVDRLDFDALRREVKEAAGLRERVEALADWCEREEAQLVVWYGHEQCVSHNAAMKLRDLLATPASAQHPEATAEDDLEPTTCDCGHGDWVHDDEAVPELCELCGDNAHCGTTVHDLMMLALHGHADDFETALRAALDATAAPTTDTGARDE